MGRRPEVECSACVGIECLQLLLQETDLLIELVFSLALLCLLPLHLLLQRSHLLLELCVLARVGLLILFEGLPLLLVLVLPKLFLRGYALNLGLGLLRQLGLEVL